MLVQVSKERFQQIINNSVRIEQGSWVHSQDYYDKDDNLIAHSKSSSWTYQTEYYIEADNKNEETITFIGNILKSKL